METISISGLKDRLSAYMESVRDGDLILVTDRKRPVALLRPINFGELSQEMQELLARGVALPGRVKLSVDEFLSLPKARSDEGLTSVVIDERNES